MKFRSLYESRIENLGVEIKPTDLKKIMDRGERKFHLKWLTDNSFVISMNFSIGTNLLFDVQHPNTKSDIIFYGKVTEIEESKTKIQLKTRSKYFLAILSICFTVDGSGSSNNNENRIPNILDHSNNFSSNNFCLSEHNQE